jgi:phage terminase small subunit
MSFTFNPVYPDATNEQKWEQIKLWRNAQLNQTDWTQLPDAPVDTAAWAIYRQALRDLPAQGGIADAAEFPVAP